MDHIEDPLQRAVRSELERLFADLLAHQARAHD